MEPDSSVEEFFRSWSVYRSVFDNDAMEHKEIFAAVHATLARRTDAFSLLDLGCGDSGAIEPALEGTTIRRYVGVDLAQPALDLAAESLAKLGTRAEVKLERNDFMAAIDADGESFDVILISFALHHFDDEAKQHFLTAARRRLNPGGEVIMIDVVRKNGESRDQYLERFCAYVQTWPIGPDNQERVIAHVTTSDFPAQISDLPTWARDAGFHVEEFYRGGNETQAGWLFAA